MLVQCKCGYCFNLDNPPEDVEIKCRRCLREEKNNKAKKAHFRVIGDVHALFDQYAHLASSSKYSLQVGDMGFDYSYISRIVNSDNHKVIGGNHDNYSDKRILEDGTVVFDKQSKHFLGEFGTWRVEKFGDVYYVRGAWSIDQNFRTNGIDWWPDEELSYSQGNKMLADYKEKRPKFVVTHSAPWTILPHIPFKLGFGKGYVNTRTATLLDSAYNIYQPDIWIFGHFHVSWDYKFRHPNTGRLTRFICLDELEYIDFPAKE